MTLEIYKITKNFLKSEDYRLVSQLRRASSSICSNIAEGSVGISIKDFRIFFLML